MTIRDAQPRDAKRLDELLTRLIHDETQYDPNLKVDCVVTDTYNSRIGIDGHKLLVAEKEGKIIGYLYGFIYQVPDIWVQPIAILDALFVEESHRRLGAASALVAEFKKFARENGACRIELKVLSQNAKALQLYRKLSFKESKKYMVLPVL